MDLGLKNKSVLVTAGSKGLGKACALEFAREGARVTIASRSEENLSKTAAEIENATGQKIAYVAVDVRKPEDIRKAVKHAVSHGQGLDVLVANAGGPPAGIFSELTDDQWYNAFDLNLMSVVRLVREAIPYMKEKGSGRIITLTSSSIRQPVPNLTLSNTLRAGVHGLTKTLSIELATDKILVNTVAPGRVATDRITQLDKHASMVTGMDEEQVRTQNFAQIPVGRYGEPEEFAKAVTFLSSFTQSYITGQALLVDGGMMKAL